MKKKNGGRVLLIILMAALITVAFFGGYKFLRLTNRKAAHRIDDIVRNIFGTDESVDETGDDSGGYKEQSSRTYDGKRIYQSCGYIYNDSGKMLSDYQEGDEYGLYIEFDVDRKRAVFEDDRTGYIINADLEIEKTIEDVMDISICYEGDYVAYNVYSSLYIYDTKTGEETLITNSGYDPVLSPDGKTVIYDGYESSAHCLFMGGLDRGIKKIAGLSESGGSIIAEAVSNDGSTVFYSIINSNEEGAYCYHDGNISRISNKFPRNCYFDRECKSMLASDERGAFYYDTSLKGKKDLVEEGFIRDILILGTGMSTNQYMHTSYVVDTDRFSDVALISTGMDTYALEGKVPKAVLLSDGGVFPREGAGEEGPVYVYKDGDRLIKSVCENGKSVKTDIITDVPDMKSLEMKADMSGGFFVRSIRKDFGDYSYILYSFNMDDEPLRVVEIGTIGTDNVRWDNLFKKCYYISDGNLYSINDDGSDRKLIGEGFSDFRYFFGGDEVPTVTGTDQSEYLIINEEVYKK